MVEDLKKRLRDHEGVILHLYQDILGLVSGAVGHLLDIKGRMATDEEVSAIMSRVEMVRLDGTAAALDEKVAEWRAVKALRAAMLPGYYEQHTTLRFTPAAVDAMLDRDIAGFMCGLRNVFSFDQFPEPAQEALLDMAFQLGVGGLVKAFGGPTPSDGKPHLVPMVRARNWEACAGLCHRAGIQEWRNTATADLFQRAAEEVVA